MIGLRTGNDADRRVGTDRRRRQHLLATIAGSACQQAHTRRQRAAIDAAQRRTGVRRCAAEHLRNGKTFDGDHGDAAALELAQSQHVAIGQAQRTPRRQRPALAASFDLDDRVASHGDPDRTATSCQLQATVETFDHRRFGGLPTSALASRISRESSTPAHGHADPAQTSPPEILHRCVGSGRDDFEFGAHQGAAEPAGAAASDR